ncbi:hypothetical protein SAMN04488096_106223 [Mesonia phycicola]|uniref:Sulfotransferase family protein n=1 Tax=Mesonia phycicola TaxID=579105 RepID=A0A1M6FMA7_9FLAO|nr:hypothetical protein [Mesonia phycicola]SHI98878.1 hypothetical protein SAMN04488096_106223 [Mesonia phycicola]
MRIFVLSTGRCGSFSFVEACKYITNYTCGHETQSQKLGQERFNYPDNHIEADNRLSWHLGELEKNFPKQVFYVHLVRNRDKTASSYNKRFFKKKSMVDAYAGGIKMTPPETLSKEEQLQLCYDYVDTVTANIHSFLKHQPQHITIRLENIKEDFENFWNAINAEGDLTSALNSFNKRHNTAKEHEKSYFLYHLKLFVFRQKKRLLG